MCVDKKSINITYMGVVGMFINRHFIYHNIRCPHLLRLPQRVSEASGLKHTLSSPDIRKTPPDKLEAAA